MGVRREVVPYPADELAHEVVAAARYANGRWSVSVRLAGRIDLPDGRHLDVDRVVRILADQHGSRPRGAAAHRAGCGCRGCARKTGT